AMMMAEALAYQSAEVEQVQTVSGLDGCGHIADEAFERATIAEHARDDVARIDLRHSTRDKFERVVSRVVGQRAHDDNVSRARLAASRYLKLVRQTEIYC